jgi:hypothetical protein
MRARVYGMRGGRLRRTTLAPRERLQRGHGVRDRAGYVTEG